MDIKHCAKCGKTKLLSEFYAQEDACDEHLSYCIECDNERDDPLEEAA